MAEEEQASVHPVQLSSVSSDEADWGNDISPPDQEKKLFKKILISGNSSECPLTGDEVFVHYTGRLLSGEVFDSSVERNEKFKFKLGQNQVIKGWDMGVATMTRGEKCLLTCTPEYAYGEAGSPPKIGPNATLQFEVELFDWKGEDVSGDGGVTKSILIAGEGYSTPEDGSMVEVHIHGTCSGRIFEERDVSFEHGEGSEQSVLSGVEQAIGKMKLKEKSRITVQAKYGYGEEGSSTLEIPPNAELVYEIRLNNFTKVKEAWEFDTLEERLESAGHLKERGGKYFKAEKYELAMKLYKRGGDLLVDTAIRKKETKEQARPMRVALHLNTAACHLKLSEFKDAIKECEEVITDEANNVKAHFRTGQAHVNLQNFEDAIGAFSKVLGLEPGNKAAQRELQMARNKIKTSKEREKKRYANMFEKMSSADPKKEEEDEKPKSEEEKEKAEPMVEKAEPMVEKDEPMVEKAEPMVEKAEPMVEKAEPMVEKAEPMVET